MLSERNRQTMNKKISNTVHSFILLPLLLGNIASPEALSEKIAEATESKGENSSLNLKIFNSADETSDFMIIDNRAAKIDAYFAQWDLPLSGYGAAMVKAADKYGIDWRLLPALAMLETTGGKNLCDHNENMNPFGYGSCKIHFDTFEEAFEAVAKTISGNSEKTAHLYKGKSVPEILEVYNPPEVEGIMPGYHKKALKVMADIASISVENDFLVKA